MNVNQPPAVASREPIARAASPSKRSFETAIWTVTCITAAAIAFCYIYYSIFSIFRAYDDEGFVLISLRSFFQGKPLYDEVYSSFQPGFYVLHWILFKCCDIPLCHDNIRLLTLVLWLAAAGLNGLITHRLTGSKLLALFLAVISVRCLTPFANEPGHPEALAYLLVACFVGLFAFADLMNERRLALAMGALGGLLLLIKINIGVFAILPAALLATWACKRKMTRWIAMGIGILMMGFPLFLWRLQLAAKGAPLWVLWLTGLLSLLLVTGRITGDRRIVRAGTVLLAICAIALLAMNSTPVAALPVYSAGLLSLSICCAVQMCVSDLPGLDFKSIRWGWSLAAMAAVVACITLAIMLRGTTLHGLANGFFRWPAKTSTSFLIRPRSNWLGLWLGVAGAATCWAYLHLRRQWSQRGWLRATITASQLCFGASVLAEFYIRVPGSRTLMPVLNDLPHFWMLPFAWLAAVTETGLERTRLPRLALLAIAIMQPLIACPVAGTQLVPASMLLPVLGAVCLANSLRELGSHLPIPRSSWLRLAAGAVAVAILVVPFGRETLALSRFYASRVPLALPGAMRIRLTKEEVDVYHAVVAELASPEVDTFLTIPGLNSFYFWARKEPPTGLNVSAWVVLLDSEQQEQVWEAARGRPGLKVVRNRRLIRSWVGGRSIDQLPLVRDIEQNFRTVFTYGGYEVMTRK